MARILILPSETARLRTNVTYPGRYGFFEAASSNRPFAIRYRYRSFHFVF